LTHQLKYRILLQRLAVCRAASGAPIPAWVLEGEFFCVTCTPDELSIVCAESALAPDHAARNLDGITVERGWIALKLEGPFPFAMTGVLASFIQPLAEAAVPIFAIATFDTDYVLIKPENLERAMAALTSAGHQPI
jgi:uncharacterized protein